LALTAKQAAAWGRLEPFNDIGPGGRFSSEAIIRSNSDWDCKRVRRFATGASGVRHAATLPITQRPPGSIASPPVAVYPEAEKTDQRAEPETRHRRTRHEQSFYPNQPRASVAGAVIEFDP
jgi:hypothetical protein